MLRYIALPIVAVVAALAFFSGTSHAAGALHSDGGSLWDALAPIYQAFAGKDFWYAGSMAVVLAVALVRVYANKPWFHTDEGAATLTFAGSFAGSLAAMLHDGGVSHAMSWALVKNASMIAVAAMGGYAAVKKLFVAPLLAPLATKLPTALRPVLRLILAVFGIAAPQDPSTPTPVSPTPAA